ncbi:MAG: sugar transferase [Candidatus Colwellbacteria bacterium]|nr:sugar transferase [Candidatus Colwellbacteria bacterium]
MLKRVFDLTFASLGLLLLSPILLAFTLWIRIDSPGPVFYRGVRAGKNFKPFRIYKFRSMVVNAEKIGGPSTPGDDTRVTKSGKFLRRFKLDELPQLINVVKGEISLVGPRPEVMEYAKLYTGEEKIVYSVKPGMTDYASLWNIDLKEIRPEKVRLQMKYVKEMSLWTDIKIILRTLKSIIS